MLFSSFCAWLEKISLVSSRNQTVDLLVNFFQELDKSEVFQATNLLLGRLDADYKSLKFQVAEKQMQAFLVHFFQNKIENFNLGNFLLYLDKSDDLGDFFQNYCDEKKISLQSKDLEVKIIFEKLKIIASITGEKSVEKKQNLIIEILNNLDPDNSKFLIKIILGKLRIDVLEMTVLQALALVAKKNKNYKKTLEEAFNVLPDVAQIAHLVKNEQLNVLESIKPTLCVPIRPASAQREKSIQAIIERIGSGFCEPKLDGLRAQIHKFRNEQGKEQIKIFSRNLLDITHMFPEIVAALINDIPFSNFIVEGELICFNLKTGNFLPFQETSKRRRKHDVDTVLEELPIKLFLFDVMLFDHKSTLKLNYLERRKVLLENFPEKSASILVVENQECSLASEIKDIFQDYVFKGYEGIIVKKKDGLYKAGKRDFNWIKVKQIDHSVLGDTLDCIILGYYSGKGRRSKFGIGALLLGIYDQENNQFESVAKLGTGLKDSEWIKIKQKMDELQVCEKPNQFKVAKELYPDFWISPKLVLEVEADEISVSKLHFAGEGKLSHGLALRFPRMKKFRFDKNINESTTTYELISIFKNQKNKID